jgi:Na+-translocating ferredoxin:NAD+ oxidoreductase RnfD subunit
VFKIKHLFNPSNFALIVGLLLFYNQAHLLSNQLGDNLLLSMVASVLALSMLVRAKRWVISLSFILFYLLLQYLLVVGYDLSVTFESIYLRFYSITFILFIYFMLSDPMTTPSRWQEQLLFTFLIAFSSVLLDRYLGYRVQHLFMMLFLFSFLFNAFTLKLEFKRGVTILLLIIVSLVWIELQPPYYFEMNG